MGPGLCTLALSDADAPAIHVASATMGFLHANEFISPPGNVPYLELLLLLDRQLFGWQQQHRLGLQRMHGLAQQPAVLTS
eukprot:1777236-Pleurochrysis_carterae.AAC.2